MTWCKMKEQIQEPKSERESGNRISDEEICGINMELPYFARLIYASYS